MVFNCMIFDEMFHEIWFETKKVEYTSYIQIHIYGYELANTYDFYINRPPCLES